MITLFRFLWTFTGITESVQKKFYELHSKQFGYRTNAEKEALKEEARQKKDDEAKRRANERREAERRQQEEEERQQVGPT